MSGTSWASLESGPRPELNDEAREARVYKSENWTLRAAQLLEVALPAGTPTATAAAASPMSNCRSLRRVFKTWCWRPNRFTFPKMNFPDQSPTKTSREIRQQASGLQDSRTNPPSDVATAATPKGGWPTTSLSQIAPKLLLRDVTSIFRTHCAEMSK